MVEAIILPVTVGITAVDTDLLTKAAIIEIHGPTTIMELIRVKLLV